MFNFINSLWLFPEFDFIYTTHFTIANATIPSMLNVQFNEKTLTFWRIQFYFARNMYYDSASVALMLSVKFYTFWLYFLSATVPSMLNVQIYGYPLTFFSRIWFHLQGIFINILLLYTQCLMLNFINSPLIFCRCQKASDSVHEKTRDNLRKELAEEFSSEKANLIKKYETECNKLR